MMKITKSQRDLDFKSAVKPTVLKREIRSVEKSMRRQPHDSRLFRQRANLYLHLGDTHKARSDFDRVIAMSPPRYKNGTNRLYSNDEFDSIGITYWLEGRRELALAFWRYSATAWMERRVAYSNDGIVLDTGILLWFAATLFRDSEVKELSRKYLAFCYNKRFHMLKGDYFQGAIASYALGDLSKQNLMRLVEADFDSAFFVNFAMALRAYEQRRFGASKKFFRKAAAQAEDGKFHEFGYQNLYFLARLEGGVKPAREK